MCIVCSSDPVQAHQRESKNSSIEIKEKNKIIHLKIIILINIKKKGAFWSLIVGLTIGLIRFIWQYSFADQPCIYGRPVSLRPAIIDRIHYMHFAIILFVITCTLAWSISLLTKPLPNKYVCIKLIILFPLIYYYENNFIYSFVFFP